MTVYGELLRLALESGEERADLPLNELIALVVSRRRAIADGEPSVQSGRSPVEAQVTNALVYDTLLVRLCQRVGVEETLTSDYSGPDARWTTERRLIDRIPALADVLD